MNLALPAVILFIIFTPGLIFAIFSRFDYKRKTIIFQDYTGRTITDTIFVSIIPAIFIHLITLLLINITDCTIDEKALGTLLTSSPSENITYAYKTLFNSKVAIVIYLSIAFMVSALLAILYRAIIILLKLDIRSEFFRFKNPLYYIFLGVDEVRSFDLVAIDALVTISGKSIIYSGILYEWRYGNQGELETLHLGNAFRRFIIDPETKIKNPGIDNGMYKIPGKYLVLKCSQIINYNFTYLTYLESEAWLNNIKLETNKAINEAKSQTPE